jgi:hypothetical protein
MMLMMFMTLLLDGRGGAVPLAAKCVTSFTIDHPSSRVIFLYLLLLHEPADCKGSEAASYLETVFCFLQGYCGGKSCWGRSLGMESQPVLEALGSGRSSRPRPDSFS